MIVRVPPAPVWLRLILILYGGVLLLWLGTEDRALFSAVLLAVIFSLLLTAQIVWMRCGGTRYALRRWLLLCILTGLCAGVCSVVTSTALMFLKNAWHAHPYPDYEPSVMLAMLARLPVWALAGALIGLALALLPFVRRSA